MASRSSSSETGVPVCLRPEGRSYRSIGFRRLFEFARSAAPGFSREIRIASLTLLLVAGLSAQAPDGAPALADASARQAADALSKRAADRLAALQKEAESLAGQERTLLGDLRKLEVEREIK